MKIFKIFFGLFLVMFHLTSFANNENKFYESGYINVNHGKLFYQSYGMGMPIIVVHGGPGLDQTYLQPQLLELAKHYKVIFYDQRGSGKSLETPMDPSYISSTQFTQDIEAIRQQLKLDQFILLGHSWGGLLSMNYAIHYPNRVKALILSDPAPANLNGYMAFAGNLFQKMDPFMDKLAPLFNQDEFNKLNLDQIKDIYKTLYSLYFYNPEKVNELLWGMTEASAKSGNLVLALISAEINGGYDLFPQLKELNVPTIVIHGDADIIPLWTAVEIQKAIPQAKMVTLTQCGHFPYVEKPKEYFTAITKFIDNIK